MPTVAAVLEFPSRKARMVKLLVVPTALRTNLTSSAG